MFKGIFGSENKGRILLYIYTNGESYAREIAKMFDLYLNGVQKHLLNMEKDGILYSKLKGTVRLFGFNPRYPFKRELEALLEKALKFIPEEEKELFYFPRLRPRRAGKPL
ncbi:MAG: winged helix-turn-helix transcriptional regulator [Candidatus Aminicenantes bacterium]|nr:winged helix-turn-helix transcriptional regulator [Candidatus Aminicenantes bacterium]